MSAQEDPDARKKLAELEEEKQWQDRAKEATEIKQQEKKQKMIEKKWAAELKERRKAQAQANWDRMKQMAERQRAEIQKRRERKRKQIEEMWERNNLWQYVQEAEAPVRPQQDEEFKIEGISPEELEAAKRYQELHDQSQH